ncbi:MAG: hypothetical protein QXK71_01500 [Pyrobaculum sp.]
MPEWVRGDPFTMALSAILVAVAMWYILFKSRLGIIIRACGEHPESSYNIGIDVDLSPRRSAQV